MFKWLLENSLRNRLLVIIGALVLLAIGAVGILSVDTNHVLFTLPIAAKEAGSAPFSSSQTHASIPVLPAPITT